ncbi:MAG: GTP-binding protein [Candidatus Heimdallarchaeota archaeon]|nr:GTP-binding protein [Candidatus Heimdallarchaeota archaeon]
MARNLYKITLLGDGGVGKTSLRQRYLGKGFKTSYMATIGADFAIKKLDEQNILQIWDLAGQSRFSVVREGYYLGTRGAIIVFDITRKETFRNIPKWIAELLENIHSDHLIPMVLIGNKTDLGHEHREVTQQEAIKYAQELSNWAEFEIPYIETSAKLGTHVDLIFRRIVDDVSYRHGGAFIA